MNFPVLEPRHVQVVEEIPSTQDLAKEVLKDPSGPSIVMARHQTRGRGRFDRVWLSDPEDSLTVSLIFREYADWPQPHLIGMAAGLAVASAVHSQIRWPNDIVFDTRKSAGILTELVPDSSGKRVPIVGIGINLNQTSFPDEVKEFATSLKLAHGRDFTADEVLGLIVNRLREFPEPTDWAALSLIWQLFDRTPGKNYRLPSGETAIALGIGSEGQLLCAVNGESRVVLAAEALFGPDH
jgi:BirA family biotin operon repressor/biotin-[acetyl-CoA-carboxylase] ligase